MNQDQRKHMGEARIAQDRAKVWADKAMVVGFPILSGFWLEVSNMLEKGIELQERALHEKALLHQKADKVIENQKRGLFDGQPSTEKTKG